MQRSFLLTLFVLSLFQGYTARAQSYYKFSKKTGTYSFLTGATVLTSDFSQPNYAYTMPAGFKVFDEPFPTMLNIGKNGYSVATGSNYSFAFDPYIQGLVARSSGSSLLAKTEITGGDTIVKIEWRNVKVLNSPASDSLNFQLWFYKKTQNIEFHYGPSYFSATFDTGVVNLSLLSTDFATNFESHSIVGTPATAMDDTDATTTLSMVGTIANGTIYSFVFSKLPVTAIAQHVADHPIVFPNPAKDVLYIQMPGTALTHYVLYDATGKPILKGDMKGEAKINLQPYPKGLYLLSVGEETIRITHE